MLVADISNCFSPIRRTSSGEKTLQQPCLQKMETFLFLGGLEFESLPPFVVTGFLSGDAIILPARHFEGHCFLEDLFARFVHAIPLLLLR